MGIFVDRSAKNIQLSTFFNGTYAFDRDPNNPFDTGYAFSNALLGSVASYTESSRHPPARGRDTNFEWYVQDSRKVASRLTIEGGLRFYFVETHGQCARPTCPRLIVIFTMLPSSPL